METIRYSKIGKEDIRFGTGTFEVRLADGRVVIMNEVDLGAIISDPTLSSSGSGTWTPTVGGTATYTTQVGYYSKIGDMVTVTCDLTINVIGTGSTSGLSGTLPYAVKSGTVFTAAVSFTSLSTSVVLVVAHGLPSGTIQLRSLSAAGSSLLTQAILTSGSNIKFTGSYLTN